MFIMKRELLLSQDTILARVKEIANQISSDYAGKEPVLIGILNGVIFFFADLVREMAIPSRIDFIRAASYGSGMTSSGTITLTKDVEIPLQDKPLIIVEDIVDTGLTLKRIPSGYTNRPNNAFKKWLHSILCFLISGCRFSTTSSKAPRMRPKRLRQAPVKCSSGMPGSLIRVPRPAPSKPPATRSV